MIRESLADRMLAFCGASAAIIRVGYTMVLAALTPGYSHLVNFNSELHAREAPFAELATLFVYAYGALVILFSIGLWRWLSPSRIQTLGVLLLLVTGFAFIAAAVFPCDPGCSLENPSQIMQYHLLAGLVAMNSQTAAVVILAFSGRSDQAAGIRRINMMFGGAAFLAMAYIMTAYLHLGEQLPYPALAQKIYMFATDAWLFVCAVTILKSRTA